MIKEMAASKSVAVILLNKRMICAVVICVSLWLISGSVPALAERSHSFTEESYLQAGSTVTVTVSSTGCTPSSATQAAGQITLKVVNQTGKPELVVQLYGSKGELIREVTIKQGATEWSESFDLRAGSYTLVAGHNAEWKCTLTVQ